MKKDYEKINNALADFVYEIAPPKTIGAIQFISNREANILLLDNTFIKIRERTPYRMWTRVIFEVSKL